MLEGIFEAGTDIELYGAIVEIVIRLVVWAVVLLIVRWVVCWYLKTSSIADTLKDILAVLHDISVKMGNERRVSREEQKRAKMEEEDKERYGG